MPVENSLRSRRDDEALHWATRLDGGGLTPADLAVLDAWLASDPSHPWRLAHHQQFYAQLHGTLPAMAAAGALGTEPAAPRRLGRRVWLAAAAAVMLGCATTLWLRRAQVIETQSGQRQSLTLADGSRADLNARTRLTFAVRGERRIARLERGEVVFSVLKNPAQPFFVETAAGTVCVTGTVFDVRVVPSGALEVAVLEGTVAVQPVDAAGRELPAPRPLKAGDLLVFDPATTEVQLSRPAAVEDLLAWREGKVVFAGTPLREALERFATYHGREITIAPEAAALPVGGRYSLGELDNFTISLEQALPVRVLSRADGGLRVILAPAPRETSRK